MLMRLGRTLLLSVALGLLSGVTQAQTPSPAQLGLVIATPNVVQVLDSSQNWATIGTVDPTTHTFTVVGGGSNVTSFNTRTGAVTLNSGDVTGALGFTPYNNTNPANYITAAGAPVQSVATRTGAVTLTHSDITDWAATLLPYALLNSPAFTGTPTAPTPSPGDSSTKLATTAFVGAAVTAGGYTLPTASTTVLGGVKVDGSTINISGGVISGAPSGITANSTATSGFAAGQIAYSDGSKIQASGNPEAALELGSSGWLIPPGIAGANWIAFSGNNNMGGSSAAININGIMNVFTGFGVGVYGVGAASVFYSAAGTAIAAIYDQANALIPMQLQVANSFNGPNSEWAAIDWQTVPNTLTIGAQKSGTGIVRPVNLVGSSISINGAAPNTNGGIGTASTSSIVAGAINTGGGSGVAPVGLADVAAGSYLKSNGVTTIPAWQAFGANVQTALGVAAGATGSVALQSGAITTGDLVKWSGATGVSDAGVTPTASGFISNGTQPTITGSGGTCATTTKVGGATAGTVVLSGVCATTNTIAWTGMPTAPNGWACDAQDRTTRTAGPFSVSASTTTGFTITMGATSSVAADVLQWKCQGY
jgi:hypothetical protein